MVSKNEVLNKSVALAHTSLDNFFKNIDLDKELFKHIYNIDIKFVDGFSELEYDYENNIILIDKGYFNLICDTYLENENKAIKNLAANIIHEKIHACRSILTNQGITKEDIIAKIHNKKVNITPNIAGDIYKIDNKLDTLKGNELFDYMENVVDTIENQHDLEEVITEALATTILLTRNKEKLDLDLVRENILNNPYYDDEKEGIVLLSMLGIDNIKKWLLAPYQDEYNDILKDFFKDDYQKEAEHYSEVHKNARN